MKIPTLIATGILATGFLAATTATAQQTQLLRGEVDSVSGTNNFVVECTNIRLVSSTLNLQQMHNQTRQQDLYFDMQVRDVSTGGQRILDVVSAVLQTETFDMGNLRFGRSESWEVFAPSGAMVWVFINHISGTSYLPLGTAGTALIGPNALLMRQGTAAAGRLRFNFQMPTIPQLVGQVFTSQALISDNGALRVTEPDCKAVRND